MHVTKRKMRYRYVIKEMTKKRLRMCEKSPRPDQCRRWIRRQEKHALEKIDRICPYLVCKHLGYCQKKDQSGEAPQPAVQSLVDLASDSTSPWPQLLLDVNLETYLTNDVCKDFESAQTLCIQVVASVDSRRFAKLYLSILHNEQTWIDQDLRQTAARAQQVNGGGDACEPCKNVMRSSLDFYRKNLVCLHSVPQMRTVVERSL